ncbi:lysylphosphatidylglycerol synthase transmembrane domain-containing protein [Prevotella sp. F0091]|uniref:lysylphosphatidylglycerol synthase transmembrane domain-containing protein n=1 Tax=Prevotella sp. F0091 TaxID=1227276 RepID=UPI0003AD464E|nr:lysylphosphatidylglycerol synthase transmembrane domain-containing protein [Prevotella sp. F0091]ERJ77613.1 hypothetical protein HMPREF9148_01173 [Prevotella sp. F0091]
MNKRFQNFFFIFGMVVLCIMVYNLDFADAWQKIQHAGYWFFAVVILWAFLYLFNTTAWYTIIRSQTQDVEERKKVSFLWLYKVTVSGFALNYATPGGLMGGEPYRIMELTPKIGAERATSSVVLYAMTHIFSHFWFWLISIFLYILTQSVNLLMGIMLAVIFIFCTSAIWFFLTGYKKGLAVRMMNLVRHIPVVKRWAEPFVANHKEELDRIDTQIASLHNQNPRTFITVVLLELSCRICSALEIFFILLVLFPSVNYFDCILILAFTSLFANMLFFIPLQLGGREGGFLMSVKGLGLSLKAGIFVALLVRIRELIWTAIGLLLIKLDRKKNK